MFVRYALVVVCVMVLASCSMAAITYVSSERYVTYTLNFLSDTPITDRVDAVGFDDFERALASPRDPLSGQAGEAVAFQSSRIRADRLFVEHEAIAARFGGPLSAYARSSVRVTFEVTEPTFYAISLGPASGSVSGAALGSVSGQILTFIQTPFTVVTGILTPGAYEFIAIVEAENRGGLPMAARTTASFVVPTPIPSMAMMIAYGLTIKRRRRGR